MHEVVFVASNISDQARRRMKVGPSRPGTEPPNGQSFLVFKGRKATAQVGREYRHLDPPGSHAARNLVDVSLDSTEERWKTGGNHGHA